MKIFLVSAIVVLVVSLGFTSCQKNYTCECTFTDSTKNFSVVLEKQLKNDATVICKDYSDFVGICNIK